MQHRCKAWHYEYGYRQKNSNLPKSYHYMTDSMEGAFKHEYQPFVAEAMASIIDMAAEISSAHPAI